MDYYGEKQVFDVSYKVLILGESRVGKSINVVY